MYKANQGRLFYFLGTPNLTNLSRGCYIIHASGSVHVAVKLFIQSDLLKRKTGPGVWKLNSSLLQDERYISELEENI